MDLVVFSEADVAWLRLDLSFLTGVLGEDLVFDVSIGVVVKKAVGVSEPGHSFDVDTERG